MIFPSLDELIAQRIAAIIEAEAQESLSESTASEPQEPEPDSSELEAERRVQRSDDHSRQRNENRVRVHKHMVTDSGSLSIPAFSDLKLKPPKKRKRARPPERISEDLATNTDVSGSARSVKKHRDSSFSSTGTPHRDFSAILTESQQQTLHPKLHTAKPRTYEKLTQPQTASPRNYEELTKLPDTTSSVARRIYNMKEVRELELRDGRTLNNLGRFNLEPALAYTRGEEADETCASCAKAKRPKGPFQRCIVLAGEFNRACCNCRYNNEASGCTLYRPHSTPTDRSKPRTASTTTTHQQPN
ncbi:hypothetical protein LHYA1_G001254 [Lachnellula hyalina]|uniref:Uncharacterized protein n=1 Tax=Lachnellula hyalina TaxID=1316788 RepID=A0A8H8U372_9HELO|nr:uncharacterized protein LHYA1_G001254 [Lachnellula hyalina]TVY29996.1 hypothetical protein LHYA1_G001254 [Lachnellula hyalina]